jgi:hypothetical protein
MTILSATEIKQQARGALLDMGVGEIASTNLWKKLKGIFLDRDLTCINLGDVQDILHEEEISYIAINVLDRDLLKFTRMGKLQTSAHLSNTYKQYKSKLVKLDKLGIAYSADLTPSQATQLIKDARPTPIAPCARRPGVPAGIVAVAGTGVLLNGDSFIMYDDSTHRVANSDEVNTVREAHGAMKLPEEIPF